MNWETSDMTLQSSTNAPNSYLSYFAVWKSVKTGAEYIRSLENRRIRVFLGGKMVRDPVNHPIIRPSVNAIAETYDLANSTPLLASVHSSITKTSINRFLHIAESPEDLIAQNKMQRRLGQLTGTCFQRCVGMDAVNAIHSVAYDIDEKHRTEYFKNFIEFLRRAQEGNVVIGGAMTDPKGDRSKAPNEQHDPDLFVHIVEKNDRGVFISGAKAHQTGCINSHWLIVMPGQRLTQTDCDYAIVGAIPVEAEGITYIYGRQVNDYRSMDGGDIDTGNARYAGQEALIVFDRVLIPWEQVFMCGEFEFASALVERFTAYHRRSYV